MSLVDNELKMNYTLVKNKELDKKKIILEHLCWFLMGAQIVVDNLARNSVFYTITAMLFMLLCIFYLFKCRGFKLNGFHITSFTFILYNIALITTGEAVAPGHSYGMLQTVSINLLLSIIIYSFIVNTKNTEKLLKLYIFSSLISNVVLLIVYKDSLFTGRLAFSWREASTYNIFGLNLTTVGSNAIAYYSSLSIIFSVYLIFKKNKGKIYYFYSLIFLVTILATGSRKGLVLLVLGLIMTLTVLNKGSKKVLYGSIGLIISGILYYLTQSIPLLYSVLGARLNEFINLISNENVNDASIYTRLRLLDQAMDLFKERPIYGYGLDAFRVINLWGIVSDSNYMEILVSGGIIGFIIYYAYVLIVLFKYMSIRKKSTICRMLFWILLITLIMEYGQVTYYWRSYLFLYSMLFYVMYTNRKLIRDDE
ncbi:hypothetical protein PCCS19_11930 [Paenibacillus sp. CCS19]|uniref:O-antigen ligase family protein n=1 Tax=Paenibacillus sp. CCS19 TaxID=3158387 RepID=UPI0025602A2E|nr:O-antigen ligase family protein [Paenibacillus cellulosilyticus]GMK38139.1 hypothetical protein PCCS19_11930 [Paenibacillus cellulosilyticus]